MGDGLPGKGPPGERAVSTTRFRGRWEEAGPPGLQTEAGRRLRETEGKGDWTLMTPRVQEVRPQPPLSRPRGYLDDSHKRPGYHLGNVAASSSARQRDASEVPFRGEDAEGF